MPSFNGLMPVGRAFLDQFSSRFWTKAIAGALLALLADHLFLSALGLRMGSTIGVFGLVLLLVVWLLRVTQPQTIDYILGALALALCLALFNNPGVLAIILLWAALGLLVLRPTFGRLADARDIMLKLSIFTLAASTRPLKDLGLLRRARKRNGRPVIRLTPVMLPFMAVTLFGSLLIWANPILEDLAGRLDADAALKVFSLERLFLWALTGIVVWSLLRSSAIYLPKVANYEAEKLDGRLARLFSPLSVLIALILCNAIFALQNGLDLAYLWAGQELPDGMTHAQYAHRGAYPLILTALLAGAFVLVALRRGSPTEHDMRVHALVYFWLAQNVFLVASAILRTLNYVADYSLTLLRLSALIWMGLVALGLVLIVLRIVYGKSGRWLINANALAAATVLYAACFLDLSALVANYNVRHAYETTGRGVALDTRYLEELGPSSIPALDQYLGNGQAGRQPAAVDVRNRLYLKLQGQQRDWRQWTWAGQRLYDSLPAPPSPRVWRVP